MKFSFNKKADINQSLNIVVPNEEVEKLVAEKLKVAQKDSKLKGFRNRISSGLYKRICTGIYRNIIGLYCIYGPLTKFLYTRRCTRLCTICTSCLKQGINTKL